MIALVSGRGRVINKVVGELLSDRAETRALLRDGIVGSRMKR